MSIQAVGWALDQDLPARPKLVLVSLANHADKTDGFCWLNATTIAQEASCKPRSVYRFIAALVHNGYVRREKRRGQDGKQRANDYWLLFNRSGGEWVELGEEIEPDANAETHGSEEAENDTSTPETQDVETPISVAEPSDRDDTRQAPEMPVYQPVEKPAVSLGPRDSGVSHIDSAEPSKTNPKKDSGVHARVPRGYAPPPPKPPPPQGAAVDDGKRIFVYEGTPAYEAWCKYKARENRVSNWRLSTTKTENGRTSRGWWFPTLYPPRAQSPSEAQRTADDENAFGRTG